MTSEGIDKPAHTVRVPRAIAARSYKVGKEMKAQTKFNFPSLWRPLSAADKLCTQSDSATERIFLKKVNFDKKKSADDNISM